MFLVLFKLFLKRTTLIQRFVSPAGLMFLVLFLKRTNLIQLIVTSLKDSNHRDDETRHSSVILKPFWGLRVARG
jgi:hypothetical protein